MKKLMLAISLCFALFGFLSAQIPDHLKSGCYKRASTEEQLDRGKYLVRHTAQYKDEKTGKIIPLGHWFAPYNPHLTKSQIVSGYKLSPLNNAGYSELVFVKPGATVYTSLVADGEFIKDGNEDIFIPNGRTTGKLQYYIDDKNLSYVERKGAIFRNREEEMQYARPIPKSPTNNKPVELHPEIFTPKIQVRENTDRQHIQQTIKQQGDFPGGVIVQPTATANISPKTVRYISEEGVFLIDGRYRYHPMLADEEIAQLAGLAFLSYDKRLAAVSQDKFSNISPNSPVALALSDADKVLGWVAYGHNMSGFTMPDSLAAPGYVNPLSAEQDILRHWWSNWDATFRIADRILHGIEPRLFLEFKEIGFKVNRQNNFLEALDLGIQINYQTFETDAAGNKVFKEEDPAVYFPEIVAAIGNFREHWSWYEAQFPELLKSRKIAETYALLKFLSERKVALEGFEALFEAYHDPMHFPIAYENYNDILPESEMVRGYAKALSVLSWLPNWIIGDEDELRICHLRLNLAMLAQDVSAIARYRKKLAPYLQDLPEDSDLREICNRLINNLPYYTANGISAKQQFADRYQAYFPDMSRQYYDACIAYYLKSIETDPDNYAAYDKLAFLYSAIGEQEQAKSTSQKMLPILEAAADKVNPVALVLLGDLYYAGLVKAGQPDKAQAFAYYQKAAETGYVYAYQRVANCYYWGNGADKNIDMAFEWYQKTADAGIDEGEYMVGVFYYNGYSNIPSDYKLAFEYFSKAAEKGHIMAQVGLGSLFFTGNAGKKDMEQSYFWFKRAADAGNVEADRIVQMFKSQGLI